MLGKVCPALRASTRTRGRPFAERDPEAARRLQGLPWPPDETRRETTRTPTSQRIRQRPLPWARGEYDPLVTPCGGQLPTGRSTAAGPSRWCRPAARAGAGWHQSGSSVAADARRCTKGHRFGPGSPPAGSASCHPRAWSMSPGPTDPGGPSAEPQLPAGMIMAVQERGHPATPPEHGFSRWAPAWTAASGEPTFSGSFREVVDQCHSSSRPPCGRSPKPPTFAGP